MYYGGWYESPIGRLFLACSCEGLAGVWMEEQRYLRQTMPQGVVEADHPLLHQASAWLEAYFAGQRPCVEDLPLAPAGGAFRQCVWSLLREIPYGQVTTYGALARAAAHRLGRERMSAQAVGGAVGHNPIAIIVPCHRVIGSDGSLTGYAGGMERKAWLLQHEGANLEERFAFDAPR